MSSGPGRKEKQPYSQKDFDAAITALQARIEKLAAVKAGMKALKVDAVPVDYTAALGQGLDKIADFCDGALKELRKLSERGNRPWDKWDD